MSSLDPVLTCKQSVAFEKELFEGDETREWRAMNQAGAAIARQARLDLKEVLGSHELKRILILVGKGHNGGDAIIASRHLLKRFERAEALLVFPFGMEKLRPWVRRSLDDLQGACRNRLRYLWLRHEEIGSQVRAFVGTEPVDLCLDGLLGMQFRPPLRTPIRELIQAINELDLITCRIAVDVPSGIGDETDEIVFQADFSYATGIVKSGLLEFRNRNSVGRVRYLDLGFFGHNPPASEQMIITERALDFRRELRDPQVHKKKQGHLFVLGGSATMPGAILMTVRSALKSGVGLVTACVPESIVAEAATQISDAMWVGLPVIPENGGLALEGLAQIREVAARATAWAIGPGLGRHPETETFVEEVLALSDAPVLLDADALSPRLVQRNWENRSCVVTPHVGEFNRLRDRPLNEPVEDEAVLQSSKDTGWSVVLKGSPTVV